MKTKLSDFVKFLFFFKSPDYFTFFIVNIGQRSIILTLK